MSKDVQDYISNLLLRAADRLEDLEYSIWYNANTCRSYEEYKSKYTSELIAELHAIGLRDV